MLREDRATGLRVLGQARDDLRAPSLNQRAPVRLLLVGDLDHVDLAVEANELAGERERTPPLTRAGLCCKTRTPFLLVIVRLRDRGVGLVTSRLTDPLVLV